MNISKNNIRGKAVFFLMSILGVLIFFWPVQIAGESGVGLSVISNLVKATLKPYLMNITFAVILGSSLITLIGKYMKPAFMKKNTALRKTFIDVSLLDLLLRGIAVGIIIMVKFSVGPEIIRGAQTGGEMMGLLYTVMVILFFSAFLISILLDFGLMDFVGALSQKFFHKLFTLPGKAALDTIASWVGSGTMGVALTTEMYQKGEYTKRESAIIMTSFSVSGVTFAITMAGMVDLDEYFIHYYLTSILAAIFCALILPRIAPLSRVSDTYYKGSTQAPPIKKPDHISSFTWAFNHACSRAEASSKVPLKEYFNRGLDQLATYWFALMPIVLSVGTLGLIVVHYTNIFNIFSMPFYYILTFFNIPSAAEAAPAMLTGFIDYFISISIAAQIAEPITRFVILCMSLVQVIYLTQVGSLILKAGVGIDFKRLFIVYLERTLVSLPIVCLVAHLIF